MLVRKLDRVEDGEQDEARACEDADEDVGAPDGDPQVPLLARLREDSSSAQEALGDERQDEEAGGRDRAEDEGEAVRGADRGEGRHRAVRGEVALAVVPEGTQAEELQRRRKFSFVLRGRGRGEGRDAQ